MKQETVDGVASPSVIHEGEHFNRKHEGQTWKKFVAIKITKATEKAFCFLIKESNGELFERWFPKSVVRVEETEEGFVVKHPEWVK